jgi:hypothetical protein
MNWVYFDESGDKWSGDQSAGAARQQIGRLGQVEMGQAPCRLREDHARSMSENPTPSFIDIEASTVCQG